MESFLYWYPSAITEAAEKLGELFDQLDYPSADQLKGRFRFEWRYLTVGPSTSRILPASLYQEEMTKFKELMAQARQEAEEALRMEFVDLVSNLTDKLNGTDGTPKRSDLPLWKTCMSFCLISTTGTSFRMNSWSRWCSNAKALWTAYRPHGFVPTFPSKRKCTEK